MNELTWHPWMSMFCKSCWSARVMSHIQISWCHTYERVDVIQMHKLMSHIWISPCVIYQYVYVTRTNQSTWHPWMSMFYIADDLLESNHKYKYVDVTHMNNLISHIWGPWHRCISLVTHMNAHIWRTRESRHIMSRRTISDVTTYNQVTHNTYSCHNLQ